MYTVARQVHALFSMPKVQYISTYRTTKLQESKDSETAAILVSIHLSSTCIPLSISSFALLVLRSLPLPGLPNAYSCARPVRTLSNAVSQKALVFKLLSCGKHTAELYEYIWAKEKRDSLLRQPIITTLWRSAYLGNGH